jgi:hypothetical protein
MGMKNIPFTLPATIIGVALIVAASIGAYSFYSVRALDNTMVVTGSAKQSVMADNVRWSIGVSRVVPTYSVSSAYNQVSTDMAKVKAFLLKNGIKAEEMTVTPIFVDDYWTNKGDVQEKNVRQTITIKSTDVNRIKTVSENTLVLAQDGVQFSNQSPEYYVSTLPALRVSLLGAAVKDARARAESIASSMGQGVGKMKSASSGVVQVLQPGSNDVSDYGQYDTSTIDKDVMVTVKATFVLK